MFFIIYRNRPWWTYLDRKDECVSKMFMYFKHEQHVFLVGIM